MCVGWRMKRVDQGSWVVVHDGEVVESMDQDLRIHPQLLSHAKLLGSVPAKLSINGCYHLTDGG